MANPKEIWSDSPATKLTIRQHIAAETMKTIVQQNYRTDTPADADIDAWSDRVAKVAVSCTDKLLKRLRTTPAEDYTK